MQIDELQAWLRFAYAEITPRAAHAVLDRFGSPLEAFKAVPDDLGSVPELTSEQLRRLVAASKLSVDEQIELVQRGDVSLITRDAPDYPVPLQDVVDRPPLLFVRGRIDQRDRFAIAIVGTRRPSPYGRAVTARLSHELSDYGLTVVSGGALGIDSVAHRTVVAHRGRTLVVLGCGCKVRYPVDNQDLFDRIVEEDLGAVISEFPLGATPEAWRFPMRNRVISGLSLGVVVVEAGEQSGALITAGYAADQGREVMAVPGNIDNSCSAGTNALIRDGARLVTSGRDVAETVGVLVLRSTDAPAPRTPLPELSDIQRKILEYIDLTPRHLDVIAHEADLDQSQVSAQLTLLELRGIVYRQPGGTFVRAL